MGLAVDVVLMNKDMVQMCGLGRYDRNLSIKAERRERDVPVPPEIAGRLPQEIPIRNGTVLGPWDLERVSLLPRAPGLDR